MTAPGAASALVGTMAEPVLVGAGDVGSAPSSDPAGNRTEDWADVTMPIPVAAASAATATSVVDAPVEDVPVAEGPPEAAQPPDAVPVPVPVPVPTVALGFADGASLELPADDPRLSTFQEAAAAVLEHPRS